jgi:hypothetical protein
VKARRSTSRAASGVVALIAISLASACASDRTPEPSPSPTADAPFVLDGRPLDPARLNAHVAQRIGFTSRGGEMRCAYLPLGQTEPVPDSGRRQARVARVYLSTLCLELVRDADSLASGSGRGGPVAVTVMLEGDSLGLAEVVVPPDGGGHAAGVRRIFPPAIAARILRPTIESSSPEPSALEARLRSEAARRLGVIDRQARR